MTVAPYGQWPRIARTPARRVREARRTGPRRWATIATSAGKRPVWQETLRLFRDLWRTAGPTGADNPSKQPVPRSARPFGSGWADRSVRPVMPPGWRARQDRPERLASAGCRTMMTSVTASMNMVVRPTSRIGVIR